MGRVSLRSTRREDEDRNATDLLEAMLLLFRDSVDGSDVSDAVRREESQHETGRKGREGRTN